MLVNNPHAIILAVALTFVIVSGGIDLSVGAIVACSSVAGTMMAQAGLNGFLVSFAMFIIGSIFGLMSGVLVQYFNVQPFIATLAMMFLARGIASMLSTDSLQLPDGSPIEFFGDRIRLYDGPKVDDLDISGGVIVALLVVLAAAFILHKTRTGRTVYAIGGKENSATLMGLPVHRTKLWVYVISGTLSGIAAVVNLGVEGKAQNITGLGWELNAIAAAVIGGTLLTGGAGYVFGSVIGAFVLVLLNVLITKDGSIPGAWTTIIIGGILLVFVLLQRVVVRQRQ
jgi:simple sugar transport system permease protein